MGGGGGIPIPFLNAVKAHPSSISVCAIATTTKLCVSVMMMRAWRLESDREMPNACVNNRDGG